MCPAVLFPIAVVEALTLYLGGMMQESQYSSTESSFLETPQAYKSMFSAAPLKPGQTWDTRSLVVTPRWSTKALAGEGWAFCLDHHARVDYPIRRAPYTVYGFVRFPLCENEPHPSGDGNPQEDREPKTAHLNPTDEVQGSYTANKGDRTGHLPEILDLRPFLKRMESEGRPVPTEESIEKMEITLKTKRRDGQSKF